MFHADVSFCSISLVELTDVFIGFPIRSTDALLRFAHTLGFRDFPKPCFISIQPALKVIPALPIEMIALVQVADLPFRVGTFRAAAAAIRHSPCWTVLGLRAECQLAFSTAISFPQQPPPASVVQGRETLWNLNQCYQHCRNHPVLHLESVTKSRKGPWSKARETKKLNQKKGKLVREKHHNPGFVLEYKLYSKHRLWDKNLYQIPNLELIIKTHKTPAAFL